MGKSSRPPQRVGRFPADPYPHPALRADLPSKWGGESPHPAAPSPTFGRYFPMNGEEFPTSPASGEVKAPRGGPIPDLRSVLPHEWGRVPDLPSKWGGESPHPAAPSPTFGRYFPMNGEEFPTSPASGEVKAPTRRPHPRPSVGTSP